MPNVRRYYELQCPTNDNMTALPSLNSESSLCSRCRSLMPGMSMSPIVVEQTSVKPVPLAMIAPYPRLTVIHRDLYDQLGGDDGFRSFQKGILIFSDGTKPVDYLLIYHQFENFVRGDKMGHVDLKFELKKCPSCGIPLYSGWGKVYLGEVPRGGSHVFPASYGTLIVDDIALNNVDRDRWKKLKIRELLVLDKPLDGLPNSLWDEATIDRYLPGQ
jgi:hypothetical protein